MSNLAVNLNLAFMKRNVALLASLLIGFVGFAQIELTPFAGYMMSGKVNGYYGVVDVKNGMNYGGALAFDLGYGTAIELMFNTCESDFTYQSTLEGYQIGQVRSSHYQVSVLREAITGGNVIPYGVYGLGASQYTSDYKYNSEQWLFSVNLGLGVKVWLNDRVGLRFSGRMYLPLSNGSVGVGIGTGGVSAGAFFWVPMVQGDFSGGLILKLGE
jgi:hypothetical protein